jgi:hypothetical protein
MKYIKNTWVIITNEEIPFPYSGIQDWTAPKKVKDVQSFLGFANFYRRFIEGFSKVCRHLTELTKNTTQYIWSEECQQSFDLLKRKFMQAPILVHFFPNRPTIVETDASDFALGAILSQEVPKEEGSGLHPVAFHSRNSNPRKSIMISTIKQC